MAAMKFRPATQRDRSAFAALWKLRPSRPRPSVGIMPGMPISPGLACLLLASLLPIGACTREAAGQAPGGQLRAQVGALGNVPSETVYNPCPATIPTCLIMPLGDSVTSGAGDEADGGYRGELFRILQKTGRPFDFVGTMKGPPGSGHEGHPSAHIRLLASYAEIWLPGFKPHVVLLMLGTNDLDQYIDTHIADYSKILEQVFTLLPQSLIVVAGVIPSGADDSIAVEFNRQLLVMLKAKMAAGKHVVAVDMHSAVLLRDLGPDNVHPVHTGYVKMAGAWNTVLDRFMRGGP
jgi:lysophospholipase L1-like esterase